MHVMPTMKEMMRIESNPRARGMRPGWSMGVHGLHTVVRVLPPDLYDRVIGGKGEVKPGESVPGGKPPAMMMHDH